MERGGGKRLGSEGGGEEGLLNKARSCGESRS